MRVAIDARPLIAAPTLIPALAPLLRPIESCSGGSQDVGTLPLVLIEEGCAVSLFSDVDVINLQDELLEADVEADNVVELEEILRARCKSSGKGA